jgi:hypothetical protein
MKFLAQDDDQVEVRMALHEMVLLTNMLHEVCRGFSFSDQEFQDIFDVARTDAEVLLRRMDVVLDRLGVPAHEA